MTTTLVSVAASLAAVIAWQRYGDAFTLQLRQLLCPHHVVDVKAIGPASFATVEGEAPRTHVPLQITCAGCGDFRVASVDVGAALRDGMGVSR